MVVHHQEIVNPVGKIAEEILNVVLKSAEWIEMEETENVQTKEDRHLVHHPEIVTELMNVAVMMMIAVNATVLVHKEIKDVKHGHLQVPHQEVVKNLGTIASEIKIAVITTSAVVEEQIKNVREIVNLLGKIALEVLSAVPTTAINENVGDKINALCYFQQYRKS